RMLQSFVAHLNVKQSNDTHQLYSYERNKTYIHRRLLLWRSPLPVGGTSTFQRPVLLSNVPDDFGRSREFVHGRRCSDVRIHQGQPSVLYEQGSSLGSDAALL